jgi:hypothetical protein
MSGVVGASMTADFAAPLGSLVAFRPVAAARFFAALPAAPAAFFVFFAFNFDMEFQPPL